MLLRLLRGLKIELQEVEIFKVEGDELNVIRQFE